jgi:NAD(P)-dependent dehydrogenase (short-subunit alcohol dehydrogenase family)
MGAPVILITGALTGIGRATAFAFAKEGATVVASGRREAEGKALEAELRSLGAEAAFILADVRHEDDVRNLVEQTVARFGSAYFGSCGGSPARVRAFMFDADDDEQVASRSIWASATARRSGRGPRPLTSMPLPSAFRRGRYRAARPGRGRRTGQDVN